ncbi:MAG: GlsB/YeaQ/YmgE family stress response membrane protein [Vulcanimicrobiaceae bacterium]
MVTSLVMIGLIVGAGVGLLVGALAGRILPGQARMGLPGDLLVGALGGLLGVLLDAWLGHGDITSASPAIVAVGLIGAVVLLNIARRMPRPSA